MMQAVAAVHSKPFALSESSVEPTIAGVAADGFGERRHHSPGSKLCGIPFFLNGRRV
jgi:hypothetical protein